MIHLDPTTWDTVTWLILAVAFLSLMVIALFIDSYEDKKTRKFGQDLMNYRLATLETEVRHLKDTLEEMERIEAETGTKLTP